MRFKFENKRYITDMTAREISGDSFAESKNHNLPIKLPDGRFIIIIITILIIGIGKPKYNFRNVGY